MQRLRQDRYIHDLYECSQYLPVGRRGETKARGRLTLTIRRPFRRTATRCALRKYMKNEPNIGSEPFSDRTFEAWERKEDGELWRSI